MENQQNTQETRITVHSAIDYLFNTYSNKDKNKRDAYALHFSMCNPVKLLQAIETVIDTHEKAAIPTPAEIRAAMRNAGEYCNLQQLTATKTLTEAEQQKIIDSMLTDDRALTYKAFDIFGADVVINCYMQGYMLDKNFLYNCQLLEKLYVYFELIPSDCNARTKRPRYMYQN